MYVYIIVLTLTALILPSPLLRFGYYEEKKYVSFPQNGSLLPKFKNSVPSFSELELYMIRFCKNYSYFATLYEIGRITRHSEDEELPIYNMVLSSGFAKPIVIIIGAIFASDLTSASALLACFTKWTTKIEKMSKLMTLYDYHFIPVMNPEGYEFVYRKIRSGEFSQWIKNMRLYHDGLAVNLFYNFATCFNEFPQEPDDQFYGGKESFSETESKIIRDYVLSIRKDVAAVFLLFSSTKGDVITYPHAHTLEKYDSWILQKNFSLETFKNIESPIEVTSTAEYGASDGGRMDDWLMETLPESIVLNIQLSYTLKANENKAKLTTHINDKVQNILEQLVEGLYKNENTKKEKRRKKHELYNFLWKKVVRFNYFS